MGSYKPIDELTLADDFLFCTVMKDPNLAKQFLEHLFNKKITNVTQVISQSTADLVYDAHGVRFDIEFEGDDEVYDIEMQQTGSSSIADQTELFCRARYYQSNLDMKYLPKGARYSAIKPMYIIFICTFDPLGYGLAKYTQRPCITELNKYIDNKTTVVYLNTKFSINNVDEETAGFLNYISNPETTDWKASSFLYAVNTATEDAKMKPDVRRAYMTLYEKLRVEREAGHEEGREEARREAIKVVMSLMNCSYEEAEKLYSKTSGETAGQIPTRSKQKDSVQKMQL